VETLHPDEILDPNSRSGELDLTSGSELIIRISLKNAMDGLMMNRLRR
jgi:hypothetical protein